MFLRVFPYLMEGASRAPFLLSLGIVAVISWGCASTSAPRTAQVSSAIESTNTRCRLEREEHIALGGLKLSLLKSLVRVAGEEEARKILSNIKRVEVATYRVADLASCSDDLWVASFSEEMARGGWWPMVVERDDHESSWVFARGDEDGDLEGLFVVAIDREELEIVCFEGRLDRVMAQAMANEPFEAGRIVEAAR